MKQKTINFLDKIKVEYRWLDHPAVFTVADLNKLTHDFEPIKNLLLQEDKGERKFLIVMTGNDRLDLKTLRTKLDSKRLRFASDETLMKTLNITPGAVSIFSLLNGGSNDVTVIIDSKLLNKDELGFHPNDNTATVFIKINVIEKVLKSMNCKYSIMSLT